MALIPITKQVHDYVITILCDNWTIVKLPIHQPTEAQKFDMLHNYFLIFVIVNLCSTELKLCDNM
jgi:hypothetical protein